MKLINTIEEYEWLWQSSRPKRGIIRMSPLEATILHFFCEKATTRIVEIGRRFGGSTFIICNCSTVPVISIDPNYHENYVKKIKEQFESRLQLINKKSNEVNLQDSYDVLFVDGSHRAVHVKEDIVNYWNNLEINGYAIFHDYWSRSGVNYNAQRLIQNSIGKEITITEEPTSQLNVKYQDIIVLQKIQELPKNMTADRLSWYGCK